MKLSHLVASTILALSLGGAAMAATEVFGLSNYVAPNQFLPLDLGMDFTVNSTITVTDLGAYTNGATPITVAIYQLTSPTSGSVVASTVIDSAPAEGSNYVTVGIAKVVLTPGIYQITAQGYGAAYGAGTFSVPEPAAWSLMLVGFGGLGAALRSRRRTISAAA